MMPQQGFTAAAGSSGGLNVPQSSMNTPAMDGSIQQVLSQNLGRYVVVDFLVGINSIVRRVGILYSVDRSFLVLYEEVTRSYQVCDIFSVKFVSFFPPGFRPTWHLIDSPNISGVINNGGGSGLTRQQMAAITDQNRRSDDRQIANLSGFPVVESEAAEDMPFSGGMTGGMIPATRSPETMGPCTQYRY